MTATHRTLAIAGIVLCGLALPKSSYAVTGCTNANITGVYNAQITSANFSTLLSSTNSTTTPGTGTGTGGSTGTGTTATGQGGFGNNSASLSGKIPGLGRYYFDGNGNIAGASASGNNYVVVGKYTVNADCSATMSLNTGETFDAVIADSGHRILFIEADANGGGAVGELDLATNACLSGGTPRTFAFSFFGAIPASAPTTATGTGTSTGTGTTTTTSKLQASSAIGSITLDGAGSFTLTEWSFANGAVARTSSTGTYSIGTNCALNLTFQQTSGATTGSVQTTAFQGLLVTDTGGLSVTQAGQGTSGSTTLTGTLIGQ